MTDDDGRRPSRIRRLAGWAGRAGRTLVVQPPARVDLPATRVWLAMSEGMHASLVLPGTTGARGTRGPDRFVEYAFGDWDVYARGRREPWRLVWNAVAPTRGALGRRNIEVTADGPTRQAGWHDVWPIRVSAARVSDLLERLDREHERGEPAVYNERLDAWLVPSDESYAIWHNCNHVAAGWLARLGCQVSGSATFGNVVVLRATAGTGEEAGGGTA